MDKNFLDLTGLAKYTQKIEKLINDKTENLVPSYRTVNGKPLGGDITLTSSDVGAVPTSRTVNGKALSSDITLTAEDIGVTEPDLSGYVPTTRTVNGKALSGDITLSASDVGARSSTWTPDLSGYVPTTRTVNGKALSSNITLSASDVSARPSTWSPDLSAYAPKASPVFTGSISLGRKSGTTVGSNSFAVGYTVEASTSYSHAEGFSTVASGENSHAEGSNTVASGVGSHAEGRSTEANASGSHAEGSNTVASGTSSHAEGSDTVASGSYSHSEGTDTIAKGTSSHAEGCHAIAYGTYNHAEGNNTFCDAPNGGHAEGNGTISATTNCCIPLKSYSGNTVTIDTDFSIYSADIISKITAGMTIYIWNIINVHKTYTSYEISSVNTSTNVITLTTSLPSSSFRLGKIAIVPEIRTNLYYPSHSDGTSTLASGENSHAEGDTTTASGNNSHAEGSDTVASGIGSHAEGRSTEASGLYSHAEGINTTASGDRAHAECSSTTASGNHSHAEGSTTIASGSCSHAEGVTTIASGDYSHAEGFVANASGEASHAEGYSTTASNDSSHASGKRNKAMTDGGNQTDLVGDVFVVGNGTSASNLSNALRLDYSGQLYLTKAYKSTGADYAEYFEWLDGNPLNEDRIGHFVTLVGNKITIAQPNDYILGVVSGQPCIIGNADEDWLGRWEHDDFNRFVKEYLVHTEVEVTPPEDLIAIEDSDERETQLTHWALSNNYTHRDGHYFKMETQVVDYPTPSWRHKANPSYDPTQPYIERQDRQEWDAVGMVGVLSVLDDGTCEVNGYAKVSNDGVATHADILEFAKSWRVIARVNDHIIKVAFR